MSCTVGWYTVRAAPNAFSGVSGTDAGGTDGKASGNLVTSNGSIIRPIPVSGSNESSSDGILTIKKYTSSTATKNWKFLLIRETLHQHMPNSQCLKISIFLDKNSANF